MQRSLTNYHIKLLAAVFMVIDHVGVVLFPDILLLRSIGRLSFPLFAWLLVQGEAHTRNVWKYGLRLLILGIISQPIFQLTFDTEGLNILFTLLIGLFCLRAARDVPQFQIFTWVGGGALAQVADVDYGAYGIGVVALLWQFRPSGAWWAVWVLAHLLLLVTLPGFGSFQFPAIIAGLFCQFANHQSGAKARWFYLFYPVHLLVIFLIDQQTAM